MNQKNNIMTREELLRSPEYWFENAQNELYRQVVEYKEKKGINQTELAEELGVTKGYVSQILKGEFNYTLKKLIEISLAVGKIPQIEYKTVADVMAADKRTRYMNANSDDQDGFNNLNFQLSSNSSSMKVEPPMVVIQPYRKQKAGLFQLNTMEQKPINVTTLFKSLELVSFNAYEKPTDLEIDINKINFGMSLNYRLNTRERLVTIFTPVDVFSDESKSTKLGSINVKGEFVVENFEEIQLNQQLPAQVVAMYIGVMISSVRGMLKLLSKGTSFEAAIIPIFNPNSLLQSTDLKPTEATKAT